MQRPPSWADPSAAPSRGCFCSCCQSRRWWGDHRGLAMLGLSSAGPLDPGCGDGDQDVTNVVASGQSLAHGSSARSRRGSSPGWDEFLPGLAAVLATAEVNEEPGRTQAELRRAYDDLIHAAAAAQLVPAQHTGTQHFVRSVQRVRSAILQGARHGVAALRRRKAAPPDCVHRVMALARRDPR